MKKLFITICFSLAALLLCMPASAQHFDPEHRHSIEISTGVPPVQSLLFGSNSYARMNGGFKDTRLFLPSVNIAYTFAMGERWDLNVVINACSAIFRRDYYPMKDVEILDDKGNVAYTRQEADFKGEVQSSKIIYPGEMYTPMVEEFSGKQEIETFDQLEDLGMIDYGNIQHAVIGYGIGSLSITPCIADANRHQSPLNDIGINLQFHPVFHPLEDH